MFKPGHPVTSGGLWFCDVLRDGSVFCQVMNVLAEDVALEHAALIAEALNRANIP